MIKKFVSYFKNRLDSLSHDESRTLEVITNQHEKRSKFFHS